MTIPRNQWFLLLLAFLSLSAQPLRAQSAPPPDTTFFQGAQSLGDDPDGYPVYYLDYFNTFTVDPGDENYVYKYDFGWLYNFGGTTDTSDDVYLYDFDSDDVFYTSADLYPYFYSFNLDTFLYYYESSDPREFYDFATNSFFFDPPYVQ